MGDILIRNVPDEVVQRLKDRAEQSGRSLQQELMRILIHEASHSVEAFTEEIRERQAAYRASGRNYSDSTSDIRSDRDHR